MATRHGAGRPNLLWRKRAGSHSRVFRRLPTVTETTNGGADDANQPCPEDRLDPDDRLLRLRTGHGRYVDSHLHSDEWSDHSRVHLVWFLLFTAFVGLVGVWLMRWQDAPTVSALIGLSFNGAFLIAGALASSYDGVVSDADGVPIQVIEFGTLAALFLAAIGFLAFRDRRSLIPG